MNFRYVIKTVLMISDTHTCIYIYTSFYIHMLMVSVIPCTNGSFMSVIGWSFQMITNVYPKYPINIFVRVLVKTLLWRHNGRPSISNHRQLHCLFRRIFRRVSKKIRKFCITGPLWGESAGDRWIPLTKGQQRGKCFHVRTSPYRVRFTFLKSSISWRSVTPSPLVSENTNILQCRITKCRGIQNYND